MDGAAFLSGGKELTDTEKSGIVAIYPLKFYVQNASKNGRKPGEKQMISV